jgi:hypothetical protein
LSIEESMHSATALVHKNIDRARHWLPYCSPTFRDLIALLPALFCEGSLCVGTFGHKTCTPKEYDLLHKYLGRRPDIPIGRLPDRIGIDSLIVCVRPSLRNDYFSSVVLICRPRTARFLDEIEEKAQEIRRIFGRHGIGLTYLIQGDTLPQLLVYEIMLTGIVLAGMQPVTRTKDSSDSCTFIGELPRLITDTDRAESDEWNPFQCFLDQEVSGFIKAADYPAPLCIPGANPFILPYLHILHRYDEKMDSAGVEKIRASISNRYTPFPPTHEAMHALNKVWKMTDSYQRLDQMSFDNALQLRKWLIPLGDNELPIFSWPPPGHMALPAARLRFQEGLWSIREAGQYRNPYPWAVLTWGVIAGLINPETKLNPPGSLKFRRDIKKRLFALPEGIATGADIIVPEDHTQGSIHLKGGRFFFSNTPFAILEKGNKFSLELFESIKKKALLDDIDL